MKFICARSRMLFIIYNGLSACTPTVCLRGLFILLMEDRYCKEFHGILVTHIEKYVLTVE